MKFTKEQALESLKSELTNKGKKSLRMSQRTLDKLTDTLIGKFADDEIGLPDFTEIAMEILNPVNDNIGKDNSDFIKKWKEEHPETEPQTTEPSPTAVENPELAQLKAEIESLKKAREAEEKIRKITSVKDSLKGKLKDKGIKDEEWVSSLLSEVNITEDLDVEAKAETLVKLYNKTQVTTTPTPTPALPSGTPQNNGQYSAIKAAADRVKSQKAAGMIQTQNS